MTTSGIEISCDKTHLDIDFVAKELAQKYWSRGIPRSTVETAIAHSLCFGVYLTPSQQQIGYARVITDQASFAYLADVFIHANYQKRGYAKQLIRFILAHPPLQGLRRWMLMTTDAHELYKQFGFKALNTPERAMELHTPHIYDRI